MNKILSRSIGFMLVFTFVFGSFINVYALADSQVQKSSDQIQLAAGSIQTQTFTDDFDNFNTSLWKSGYVWGSSDINMGKANPANISIVKDTEGSHLCLKAPAQNDIGAIASLNTFGYGTYTARMKYTASNGTWPSFWALKDGQFEVDTIEALGNAPDQYYMTVHSNGSETGQKHFTYGSSLADHWHVYSFTWTPTNVTFYFDGTAQYVLTMPESTDLTVMFTMGIMGNGTLWDGNKYDSTTWANGIPTLCVDYFSYVPSTTAPATFTSTPISSPTASPTIPPTTTFTSVPTFTATSVPPVATSTVTSPSTTQTTFDDKNSGFIYSSGWMDVSKRQAYKHSFKSTNQNGSSVTFGFTGQALSILYKGGTSFGKVDVYVDGILVGTINEYTAKPSFQQRWNYPGSLTPGAHTLKLVFVTTGTSNETNGSIDAVIVN